LPAASRLSIKGFVETSFIDWKGKLSSVLFCGGCNFRCPFCHNSDLVLRHQQIEEVPLEYVLLTLRKYRDWVGHVVVTGGEPTTHMNLFQFLARIKTEGMKIKLDTNGSNPSILKGLVNEGLIDYIAMDFKGPLDRYDEWCGTVVDISKIEESVEFILGGTLDYEFRMTVVPFLHREEDVYEAAEHMKHARKFMVQEFKPRNTLNPAYMQVQPFAPDKMESIRQTVAGILRSGQTTNDTREQRAETK
jgi:pyruvate formate lyase activating enzyme